MAKFFGKVGFMVTEENAPGVYEEKIEEHDYYGDVIRQMHRWESYSEKENDDINVNNQISILADDFALNHLQEIRYVEWYGAKWKVTSFEVSYPRILISIGGVYNGDAEN